jgi:cytochrome P450
LEGNTVQATIAAEGFIPAQKAPVFKTNPIVGPLPQLHRDALGFLVEAADKCGDIVRLQFPYAPHVVHLLRNADHIHHVLVENQRNYVKETRGYEKLRDVLGLGLVTSEGEFWKRNRRIANPAFHRERIARFGDTMAKAAEELVADWEPWIESGRPFDVATEMSRVTLKIVGLTLMSKDVSDSAQEVSRALTSVLHTTIGRVQNPLTLPLWIPTPANREFLKARATLDKVVLEMIAQRRAENVDHGDLLSMFINTRDEETGETMNDRQLRDEVMTMFLAGHETTATALAWTFYLLSKYPTVERELRAEITSVLGGRTPTMADLPRLTLIDQVVKESMRLYPPVWMIARSPVADDVIGGYEIPKGTYVFMSPYLVHRNPAYWSNPEGFDPSRWTPEAERTRHKHAYLPFSMGPRKCIGDMFATMEARLVLATILQRVQLSLVSGARVSPVPTVTLRPHGVMMQARRAATPGNG